MVVLLAFLILYLILIGFALAKGKASKGLLSNVDENMCKYVDSLFENDSELKTLAENASRQRQQKTPTENASRKRQQKTRAENASRKQQNRGSGNNKHPRLRK